MSREKMLKKLRAIPEPLVEVTVFSDGIYCDYVSSNGCGRHEFWNWDEFERYPFDNPDHAWEELSDDELEEWFERFENDVFYPIAEEDSDSEIDEQEDDEDDTE